MSLTKLNLRHLSGSSISWVSRFVTMGSWLFVAALLYRWLGDPISWPRFTGIGADTVLIVIVAQGSAQWLAALQWRLLQSQLHPVSIGAIHRIWFSTIYAIYLPIRGSAAGIRVLESSRNGIPGATAFLSIAVHLTWRGILTFTVGSFVAVIVPQQGYALSVVPFLAIALTILMAWQARGHRPLGKRVVRFLVRYRPFRDIAPQALFTIPVLVQFVSLFMMTQLIVGLAMKAYWASAGYEISLPVVIAVAAASHTAASITQIPGGLAAQEISYAFLLSQFGVPREMALAGASLEDYCVLTDLILSASFGVNG